MLKSPFRYTFIISSPHEPEDRLSNVELLQQQIPRTILQPAIFPNQQKVPFLEKLRKKSGERTGVTLNAGEIGVLLANRCIWRQIVHLKPNEEDIFLILESDSKINNYHVFREKAGLMMKGYDLFFFGGWTGRMMLKRSTIQVFDPPFKVGDPYIKTVCSGYGYAINLRAAKTLLQYTKKIAYPVDEFKKYLPANRLKIGGVVPELVSEQPGTTTIGHPNYKSFLFQSKMFLVHLRNSIVSYFS